MDDKINSFTMVEPEGFSPTGKIHIFSSTHVPGFLVTSIGGRLKSGVDPIFSLPDSGV